MKRTVFILLLCSFLSIQAKEKAIIQVNSKLLYKEKISPLINGGFIELLLDYTNSYGGMWAQEITDRGFDYMPNNQYKYWDFWYSEDGNFNFVKNIEGGYNENGKYAIEFTGNGNIESGIYQRVYINDEVSHNFYIYVKNKNINASGKLKFVAFDLDFKKRFFEKDIDITSSEWEKIQFEIPALKDVYSYNLAITYQGTGSVAIDEISLMPSNNELGIRKEYADILRLWNPGILRYPGGGFADLPNTYWLDAVGSIDKRLAPHFDQMGTLQRMDMGIDEYMAICKKFHIEPYLVLNFTRSIKESLNWIEYCNGDSKKSLYGKLRTQNGNPEPYNVKYWEIGNEQYYYGILNYIPKYIDFYKQIKEKDATLRLISDGNSWNNTFDTLMEKASDYHDIYGFHPCGGINKNSFGDDEKTFISVMAGRYTEKKIDEYEEKINKKYHNLKLASTEWWSSYGSGTVWLYDTISRNRAIEAALWNVYEYLAYMRRPYLMEFAARTIGIGIMKHGINSKGKKVIYATPALYAIALASNRRGDYLVKNKVNCNEFFLYEIPYWAEKTPYLDVTTSISKDSLFIAVVNRHSRESISTDLLIDFEINQKTGKVYQISSEHFLDCNSVEEPTKILPQEKEWDITDKYVFPKHSFTVLAIPIKHSLIVPSNQKDDVKIFPIPTYKECKIEFDKGHFIEEIQIFDMLGNKVFSKQINKFEKSIFLNELNLAIGAYTVRIKCLDKIYNSSIIIRKSQ